VNVAPGAAAELGACDTMPEVAAASKGGGDVPEWSVELSMVLGPGIEDAYTKRLGDFGYAQQLGPAGAIAFTALHRVHPYAATGIELGQLLAPEWKRSTDLMPLRFQYHVTTISGVMRGERSLLHSLHVYGQGSLGLAIGGDELTDETGKVSTDRYWSYVAGVGVGMTWTPIERLGLTLEGRFVHAPAVDNLIGDTHDAGGLFVGLGLEYRP
jgi:hypothetical protein